MSAPDATMTRPRLALVSMPWNSITLPSTALSILKPCAARAGWDVDVFYLNVRFSERIGFELYEHIANRSALYPEWFFSAELFGVTGRLANRWDDLRATDVGRHVIGELIEHCRGSEEAARAVADAVAPFVDDVMREIDWTRYRVAGFTVTHAQTCSSALLARRIKAAAPGVATVFGGGGVDADMGDEFLRAFEWADYVVQGEAEDRFMALLARLASAPDTEVDGDAGGADGIAGVRSAATRDRPAPVASHAAALVDPMDAVPAPDHDDYFRQMRRAGVDKRLPVSISIECSRGCWWGEKHHCTFCGLNGTAMRYRSKSPRRVYEEVVGMARRYRCLNVLAVDKILDMNYCRELFPLLARDDLDLNLFFEVKSNLTDEQVQLMAAAGVRRIQPGIESFNTDVLRLMKKGVTAIQNVQFLKSCKEAGIEPFWNILYGFPGEEPRHYQDLDTLLRLLFHLSPPVDVCPVVFERFSPYVSAPHAYGLRLRPFKVYEAMFPASIDMDRLGAYFEPVAERGDTSYIEPAITAFREWRDAWKDRPPVLTYEQGPGFAVLHDSRPWHASARGEPLRIVLGEAAAALYAHCHAHRSRASIDRVMQASFGTTDAQVDGLLRDFVENGLMMREEERYLSLAVRKRPPAAAQRPAGRTIGAPQQDVGRAELRVS